MATLTYDPTPADQPEFNEAEQEALKIGEAAQAEEQQMYAGKFKDAEALEKAYLELQSKLGEPRESEPEPQPEPVEEQAQEDLQEQPEDDTLTESEAKELQDSVGGAERYNEMLLWAAENLSKEEIEMFDAVVGQGDKNSCFFAINALNQRYTDAIGNEKPLLTGRGSRDTLDVFRSQAEVVAAMQDARYDADPAYRQDVFEKLSRSNISY